MNWEAIGATAEGLGAAGVLITLIYLVGQVRTSNRLIFSEGRRSDVGNITQFALAIADSREMAELFVTGLRDPEVLDQPDRIRFTWMMAGVTGSLYGTFTDRELGLIPEVTLATNRESFRGLFNTPGGRWWWENRKGAYSGGFVEHVERVFFSNRPDS